MADYKNINIRNKRATFDYEIIEEWIAGIVLAVSYTHLTLPTTERV